MPSPFEWISTSYLASSPFCRILPEIRLSIAISPAFSIGIVVALDGNNDNYEKEEKHHVNIEELCYQKSSILLDPESGLLAIPRVVNEPGASTRIV